MEEEHRKSCTMSMDGTDMFPKGAECIEEHVNESPVDEPKPKKQKRRHLPLPPEIADITIKDKDRFVFEKVQSSSNEEDTSDETKTPQYLDVAVAVKPKGEGHQILLDSLTLQQLRDFAKRLTVSGSSRLNTFQCKHAIAVQVITYAAVSEGFTSRSNESKKCNQKRYNTLVRLTNVIFSEDFLPTFLMLNDNHTREDHEVGVGGSMQYFWKDVSLALSAKSFDDEEEDPYGEIDHFEEDNDDTISKHIDEAIEDPKDYTPQSGQVLEDWTKKLIRVHVLVKQNMTQSGTHSSDIFDFVECAAKKLKVFKLLGTFPVYYFCLKAAKSPNIDTKFQPFLNEDLKGDSTSSDLTGAGTPHGRSPHSSPIDMAGMLNAFKEAVELQKEAVAAMKSSAHSNNEKIMEEIKCLQDIMRNVDKDKESQRYSKYQARLDELENKLFGEGS